MKKKSFWNYLIKSSLDKNLLQSEQIFIFNIISFLIYAHNLVVGINHQDWILYGKCDAA